VWWWLDGKADEEERIRLGMNGREKLELWVQTAEKENEGDEFLITCSGGHRCYVFNMMSVLVAQNELVF